MAAKAQESQPVTGTTLVDVAKQHGMFGTFLAALDAEGMTDLLKQSGPYTVFAPTDEAFALVPAADLQALLKDKPRLKQVLGYHFVPKKKYDWEMRRDVLQTLDGSKVTVNQYSSPEDIRVNSSVEVLEANIPASNGVMHAIDQVMIPQG